MMAVVGGHNECVSILVANGADVNIATRVSTVCVSATYGSKLYRYDE